VGKGDRKSLWRRWVRQPQKVWLRRIIFQVHLWSGLSLGLYVFFISVTGSVLVYRNELYEAAMPAGGMEVGDAVPRGFRMVTTLIELHDNFLIGPAGRWVNGFGAVAIVVVAITGLIIWWPGIRRWRRSLTLHRGLRFKRMVWDLHSMVGFWTFASIIVFAVSGVYLSFPEQFHAVADRLQPMTAADTGPRFADDVLYWLAFLHFGRINGIGIPCSGPGLCDQTIKAVWALFGLAPAVMFVTGTIMWWNRVLRRWWRRGS
jgi:uncharacterized iron-regulated membrane protein